MALGNVALLASAAPVQCWGSAVQTEVVFSGQPFAGATVLVAKESELWDEIIIVKNKTNKKNQFF